MRNRVLATLATGAIAVAALAGTLGGASIATLAATPSPTPASVTTPYAICGGGDGYTLLPCNNGADANVGGSATASDRPSTPQGSASASDHYLNGTSAFH